MKKLKKVNALKIRQSFGAVLKDLKKSGEPLLIEKAREPVAVLLSLETFKKRFLEYQNWQERQKLFEKIRNCATPAKVDSLKTLRELRYGSGD